MTRDKTESSKNEHAVREKSEIKSIAIFNALRKKFHVFPLIANTSYQGRGFSFNGKYIIKINVTYFLFTFYHWTTRNF